MKQQALVTLSVAAAALICGCATKDSYSAMQANREAAAVTAAEERQMQAEVSSEPVIAPNDAEPLPVIETEPVAKPAPAPVVESKPVVKRPKPAVYTVTAGDSVSALSVRFGVRQADILALNPALRDNPDKMQIGQKVYLPAGTDVTKPAKPRAAKPAAKPAAGTVVYEVQAGDVLGGIAVSHGVSIASIVKANNLKNDTIFVGQKLQIPGAKSKARVITKKDPAPVKPAKPAKPAEPAKQPEAPKAEPAPAPVETPAPAAVEAPLPPPPAEGLGAEALPPPPEAPAAATQTYVVQPGEDLVGIALKWGITPATLRAVNGLDDSAPADIAPGTTLKIPAGDVQ